MHTQRTTPGQGTDTDTADHRARLKNRPTVAGVPVREDDIEPVKGIRTVALLFRGMSVILLILMILQVAFGLTSAVPISVGVLLADAVRLIIFAGLLWGAGDLAVLGVKSHDDLRAMRILTARMTHMMRLEGERSGTLPPPSAGSREGREA